MGSFRRPEPVVASGDGTDTVAVGNPVTLNDVRGIVILDGMTADEFGRDLVTFADSAHENGDLYTLRADEFAVGRLADLFLTYVGFEDLGLTTGKGEDTVQFDGVTKDVLMTVAAGDSYDTLEMIDGLAYDPTLTGFNALDISGGTLALVNTGLTVEDMTQSAGTHDGPALLRAVNTLLWTGGTMTDVLGPGIGQTVAGGPTPGEITFPPPPPPPPTSTLLTIAAGSGPARTLADRELVNYGTADWLANIVGGTGLLENRGVLFPAGDETPGHVGIAGAFAHPEGQAWFDLAGAGSVSDRIVASQVSLAGQFVPTPIAGFPASQYKLIDNTGPGPVVGTFSKLSEGSLIYIDDIRYQITYQGGDGNDVVLTRVIGIGNMVWADEFGVLPEYYHNGGHDEGEPPLPYIVVKLFKSNGTLFGEYTTGADGMYQFYVVEPVPDYYYLTFSEETALTHRSPPGGDFDSDPYRGLGWTDTFPSPAFGWENDDNTWDAGYWLGMMSKEWQELYSGGGIGGGGMMLLAGPPTMGSVTIDGSLNNAPTGGQQRPASFAGLSENEEPTDRPKFSSVPATTRAVRATVSPVVVEFDLPMTHAVLVG